MGAVSDGRSAHARHDRHVGGLDDPRLRTEQRRLPGYDGVVGVDETGAIRHVSEALDGRFGLRVADLVGRSMVDYIDPDDLVQALESFGGVAERAGYHQVLRIRLITPAGARPVDVVAENCLDDPDLGLILFNIGDPNDRRRSIQLLDAQAEVVRTIALGGSLEASVESILGFVRRALPGFRAAAYFHDAIAEGRATAAIELSTQFANRMATAIRTDRTVPGAMALDGPEAIIAADLGDAEWAVAAEVVGAEARSIWSVPIRYERGAECLGCIEIYGPHPAHPSDEDWVVLQLASRLAAVAFDRVAMERRLVHDAEIDPLTGTPNRRVITSVLRSILAGADRGHAVCFIDLDRLKVVNDGLGHEAGDQVIREAAKRLQRTIGDAAVVGRFGGDEFVAIANDPEMAHGTLAERCLQAFEEPVVVVGRRWRMTASIGVVRIDAQRSSGEVLRDADAAMYEAKRAGRNRWRLFGRSTRDLVVRRMRLEQQVPQALERGDINAAFQPVVATADWSLCGVETLARWRTEGGEVIQPDEFVPLVEELGFIDQLGNHMIEQAFDMIDGLHDLGFRACQSSVNVSPLQLQSGVLFDRLAGAAADGRPVSWLCLEMTEQHMIDETDQTLDHLAHLLEFGVGLAVDDFGTGYSSLGALHRLPAHTLKIDRRLVRQIRDDAGRSVVAAVIGVARAYGMATIAEGVETIDQALVLRHLGVDALQGFLFARPEPCEALIDRLSGVPHWPWDVGEEDLLASAAAVG